MAEVDPDAVPVAAGDGAVEQLALAVTVDVDDMALLGIEQAVGDHLLGDLGRDAPEILGLDRPVDLLPDPCAREKRKRGLQLDFARVGGHVLDHHQAHGALAPLVVNHRPVDGVAYRDVRRAGAGGGQLDRVVVIGDVVHHNQLGGAGDAAAPRVDGGIDVFEVAHGPAGGLAHRVGQQRQHFVLVHPALLGDILEVLNQVAAHGNCLPVGRCITKRAGYRTRSH